MSNSKMIMVYVETAENMPVNASLEALSEAVVLSKEGGYEVAAVLIGKADEKAEAACKEYGASKIIEVEQEVYNVQAYGEVLAKLIEKYKPEMVLAGTTAGGKEITAYAASKIELVALSNVTAIEVKEGPSFTISMYGGSVLRDVQINTEDTKIVVLAAGSFKKEANPAEGEVIKEDLGEIGKDLKTIIKESVTEIAESVNLEEAEIIVSCGRGMGTEEGYKLVEELAKVLGGAIGATRPVTESGLVARTQQVGQSGKIVSPKLYIGCGVSGAVQHVSGMIGSDYIVAINKDEDAPIFEVADVGMVGDAMVILPLLIEEMKKLKEQ